MNVLRTNREILHASWKLFQVNESTYLIITFSYSPGIQTQNKRKNPLKAKILLIFLDLTMINIWYFDVLQGRFFNFTSFTHNQAKFSQFHF